MPIPSEPYDRENEPWEDDLDIPALDILKEAVREESHFALWEVDYIQWPWSYYPDEALGD